MQVWYQFNTIKAESRVFNQFIAIFEHTLFIFLTTKLPNPSLQLRAEIKMAKANKKQQKQLNLLSFLDGSIAGKEGDAWKEVKERFNQQAYGEKLFKDKFGDCIGMNKDSKDFADELFDVLTKRKKIEDAAAKGITLQQLEEFWKELLKDDLDTRLEIFFDLCDKNDDNKISKEEVMTVLKWTASANKLSNIKKNTEFYASLIVQELDSDRSGFIELEDMKHTIRKLWKLEEGETEPSQDVSPAKGFLTEAKEIINEKRICFLTLWLAINLGLFVWKFKEYKEKEAFELMGFCAGVAKGSAETLKLNMGLVLFLACRGTLTRLRSTFLSSIFPFDDHLFFHMLVGLAILLASFVHMFMHFGCGFPILSTCLSNRLKEILPGPSSDSEFKQPSYFDLALSVPAVTGILMVIIMVYCFTLAIPFLRKSDKKLRESFHNLIGFNAFWYAHHLLLLLYVLMILHGYFTSLAWDWLERTTWMYIAFPVLVYASERLLSGHEVKIKDAIVSSGDDLVALYWTKPEGFKYQSGMYLFVNCPEISKFEWHPFSITSAPGDKDVSLHIGKKGDWKKEFINKCKQARKNEAAGSSIKYPQIFIKGPYGAPSQNYKDYDILLLIGLGVGATPMISILKDVLNHIKANSPQSQQSQANQTANNLVKEVNSPLTGNTPKVPKRAYFYWVTGTQESFEWFKGVMNDVAEHDEGKIIEMHTYLSSMQKEGDVRSVFITILQNIRSDKISKDKDIISETRVRAQYGKPDWEKVFKKLKSTHEGSKIGVFYCGPSSSKDFHRLCTKYSQDPPTSFHFHTENF